MSTPHLSLSILKFIYSAANSFTKSWMHEIIGFSLCSMLFIVCAVWTASFWCNAYFSLVQIAILAECLVLDARPVASIDSFGMDRETLYRAEVSVYVFASAEHPASCDLNVSSTTMLGPPTALPPTACGASDGWVGTAFEGIYSLGDKSGFLRAYGQPGTFYPCWHSHDHTVVILARDLRTAMVLPPLLVALAALAALARVAVLAHAAAASPSAVAAEEECEEEAELVMPAEGLEVTDPASGLLSGPSRSRDSERAPLCWARVSMRPRPFICI
jgi:hypothetical protein